METLSEIVDELNERFGLTLDERDQLLFDQFERPGWPTPTWPRRREQHAGELPARLRSALPPRHRGRMDENEAIFRRILDDDEFRKALIDLYATRVYRQLHDTGPDAAARGPEVA